MASWGAALATYRQPRLLAILCMGFSSGLPLPLTGATLSFWLAKEGVSRTSIGLFSLIGSAYVFKFVWSPLIDRLPIPVLTRRLGRRRSWALSIQALLAPAILVLGFSDPGRDLFATALASVVVAFLSASQDIVIDAYRIELLTPEEQGAGAAATQWGYRFGLLASGAGALYAVAFGGWAFSYSVMAALMAVGFVTVCLAPEPGADPLPPLAGGSAGERLLLWLQQAAISPLADFFTRPHWLPILLFIVLYKYGDALAGVMATPLYVALRFTETEVASISKVFGVFATLAGVALGGVVVARLGLYGSLLFCGIVQNLATLMYAALALAGHDLGMLALSIALENVTGGMGSAAFVAYLSRLCHASFTATQYALFSALFAFSRIVLSAPGGWLAERIDWVPFFFVAAAAGIPGLLLLLWLMRRTPEPAG
ncbi:MAG TPA: AmpG family muropeptide MFS transporter [Stellaceae bacterium]|nr:AmpG family muropeptide MFS transporter [Stellaceae bacterium]